MERLLPQNNLPIFSAHLAQSSDQGVTFTDQVLLTFLSSAIDDGNARQPRMGDYMQMKAVGHLLLRSFHGKWRSLWPPFRQPRPDLLQGLCW